MRHSAPNPLPGFRYATGLLQGPSLPRVAAARPRPFNYLWRCTLAALSLLLLAAVPATAAMPEQDTDPQAVEAKLQRLQESVDRLQSTMDAMLARGLMIAPPREERDAAEPAFDAGELFGRAVKTGPRLGRPDAAIQILEFGDYECPFCKRMAGIGAHLAKAHPDLVSYVFRNRPGRRHKRALEAARAAWAAARQNQFWAMQQALFAAGPKLEGVDFVAMATGLGLDRTRFEKDLASPESLHAVERDVLTARFMGASVTPTFFVNGRKVVGANPEELVGVVDDLLDKLQNEPPGEAASKGSGAPTPKVAPPSAALPKTAAEGKLKPRVEDAR